MEDRLILQLKNAFAEIPAANEAASRWLASLNAPPGVDTKDHYGRLVEGLQQVELFFYVEKLQLCGRSL